MAAHSIEIPDEFAEALRAVALPVGTIEADSVALDGVLRWSIQRTAREISGLTEAADKLDTERIRTLASRIEAMAWVRDKGAH